MKKRIAIISTHPIQYNAPLFRLLAASDKVDIHVFYTWSQARKSVEDADFKQCIVWDIPLLEGYGYTFVKNISNYPKQHFKGLNNPDLIPAIEHWGADAVWIFGWNFQSHFKVMRHFKGKLPVWFRGDSTLLNDKAGLKSLARNVALRWVYRYVDKAFYVGINNRCYFKKYGLKEPQLVFAPHAVENSRFGGKQAEAASREWRKELGYTDDEIVMVYAGKFIDKKNLLSFVKQFKAYTVMRPDSKLRLLLIGNGAQEESLRAMLDQKITILPFQNQSSMPVVYCVGNLFVLPSCSETWGLGVNEAMASGRAVVVTDLVGCAADLVKDGINGYYFDLEQPQNNFRLFETIESANLQEMGKYNKNFISKWSYQEIVEAVEKVAYEKK